MPVGEPTTEETASYHIALQTTRPENRTLSVEYTTAYGEDLGSAEVMMQDLIDAAVGSGRFRIQEAVKITRAWAPITATPEP